MKKKTILAITTPLLLVLITAAIIWFPFNESKGEVVNQNLKNRYLIYGRVTHEGKPVIGSQIKAYIDGKPEQSITTKTKTAFNGFYELDINKIPWKVGEVLVLRAASSGLIGEERIVLRGSETRVQESNVQMHTLDYMSQGTHHYIKVRIMAGEAMITGGHTTLKLNSDSSTQLLDQTVDELGYFVFDLAQMPAGWYVGDLGTIKAYYQDRLLVTAQFTVNSDDAQHMNVPIQNG